MFLTNQLTVRADLGRSEARSYPVSSHFSCSYDLYVLWCQPRPCLASAVWFLASRMRANNANRSAVIPAIVKSTTRKRSLNTFTFVCAPMFMIAILTN